MGTDDALQRPRAGLRNLPRKGPEPSGGILGSAGQCGRQQPPSHQILACAAVSLGSSKERGNWKGFLLPLCLLGPPLQSGSNAFLLLSVHLAGNPSHKHPESGTAGVRGSSQSPRPWALMPAAPSKLGYLWPLAPSSGLTPPPQPWSGR